MKEVSLSQAAREVVRQISTTAKRDVRFIEITGPTAPGMRNPEINTLLRQETQVIHLSEEDWRGSLDALGKRIAPDVMQLIARLRADAVAFTHDLILPKGQDAAREQFAGWCLRAMRIGNELRIDVLYSRRSDERQASEAE